MKLRQLLHRIWHWIQPGKHCRAFCPTCEFFQDCEWETKHQNEEYRCEICKDWDSCPAYKTGVIYPCPYFKMEVMMEETNGQKE